MLVGCRAYCRLILHSVILGRPIVWVYGMNNTNVKLNK